MNSQRVLGWVAFFGVAVALAWLPELLLEPAADDAVQVPLASAKARTQGALPAAKAARGAVAIKDLSPAGDLFAARSWKPAAVLASVTEQPVSSAPVLLAPSAPAMPFQFIGRLDDRRDRQVFLQDGEKIYVVRQGDVIDDTWRIEGISEQELSLVYLPLHLSQTLSVGSTQ